MNPTQLLCKWVKEYDSAGAAIRHELPKLGGVELRMHKADGKVAHYFCSIPCLLEWVEDSGKAITL